VANRKLNFNSVPGQGQHRMTIPNNSKADMKPSAAKQAGVQKANNVMGMSGQQIANHVAPVVAGAIMKHLGNSNSPLAKVVSGLPESYRIAQAYGIKLPDAPVQSMIDHLLPGVPVFKMPSKKGDAASVMNSSYGLSKAPEPKPVILNSGISPNTYTNDYMVAIQNLCAPMHVSCNTLQIPTNANNSLSTYFTNVICFDIQTAAQSNVGFDLQISTNFTSAQILTATNAAINALQVYYWYASILAYESDPKNKNEGMIVLRQNITSQQISDLNQLGRRLEDTPIPPRVVLWVKYMMSNYYNGETPGSSITKICFNAAALNAPTTNFAVTALNSLNSPANTTVFALLRRSIPKWRVGKLYDVTVAPNFDKNFKTIFANLPSAYINAVPAYTPSPQGANASSNISYNTYSNRLDGVAYAMGGVFNNTTGAFEPGMTNPVTLSASALSDSRYSWANNGTISSWTAVNNSTFLSFSRDESSTVAGGVNYTPHLVGAEKCQNVSSTTMTQSAQNTLDFLFDVNSIPVKGKISQFSSSRLVN
jgi:hypothetical protein